MVVSPRIPPQASQAEAAVLAAILCVPEALVQVTDILSPADFYHRRGQLIFAEALLLASKNEPVDIVTMADSLRARGLLDDVGGVAAVAELTDSFMSAANVRYHAKIVHEKALLRRFIATVTKFADTASDYAGGDVYEFIDQAEQGIFKLTATTRRGGALRKLGDTLIDWGKELERRKERSKRFTGTPTGFDDLDRMTSGLHGGNLVLIAGRPGMGKTALSTSISENVAIAGMGVLIASLEMSFDEIRDRLMAGRSRVELARIRSGDLAGEHLTKISKAIGEVVDACLYVDDTPALSTLELRTVARRLKADRSVNLGLVIVDYVQLMRSAGRHDNREQEVSEISRSLKALAKELSVPVIALSQLNREVEKRNPPIPRLSDLRESGSLEQDADAVLFVYREAYYRKDSTRKNETDLIVAKQRNGPTGNVTLTFVPHLARFENFTSSTWRTS
jgi:replicative DNA helicase